MNPSSSIIYPTEIESLRQQVTLLRDFVIKISEQIPEKPDHWSSCSQCEHNSSDAQDIIEALSTTAPKESEMSEFPETLIIGQLLTRELTKEIERRYNTYVELERQLAAKQAEIDALMLEYCPNEMSQEQLDNWAAHQRPAKENEE